MTLKEDREREKSRREALGKFLYNLAQTCFTAMVVGAVVTYFMANVKTSTFLSFVYRWISYYYSDSLRGKLYIKEIKTMIQGLDGLIIVLGGTGIVAILFAIWLHTKSGEKWLKSLDD
jgi:hypothetical protein